MRTKISEYSTTNSDNTDIENINIAENCPPSGINNAIREVMVHLKEFQTGASGDPLTVAGAFVASGASTVALAAGAVGTPSLYANGDTNTGIFFPAADTIAFAEGGVEAMRISSSAELLVGTTTSAGATVVIAGLGAGSVSQGGSVGLFRNDTSVVTNDALGSVNFYGNDTTGNTARLLSYVRALASGDHAAGDNPTDLVFATTADGSETVTERMRITSAGEVLVGGTTELGSVSGVISVQRTGASPSLLLYRNSTAVSSGNVLGQVGFWGNDTTSNTPTQLAYIQGVASGTHAAGDNPTDIVFGCTNDNSATVTEFARLSGASVNSRGFTVQHPTLANNALSYLEASGGTAGTINRFAQIGVYKHSGITNSCGLASLWTEDDVRNNLWVDNSDVLRISTSLLDVGTTGGTVVGTQTSDERLKNISGPVTYGLNEVLAIEPIAFTMKDDPSIAKIGFSAQQIQPLVPEAVYDTKTCIDGYTENEETKEQVPNSDRTKLAMDYSALIPVLVNAVKELSAKCDALQAEVDALKGAA